MAIPTLVSTKLQYIRQDPTTGDYWVDKKLDTGRRFRRKCGPGKDGKKAAQKILEMMDQIQADMMQTPVRLSELAKRYRADDQARNRQHRYHEHIENRLVRDLNDPKIAKISPMMVSLWQQKELARGLQPASVNRVTRRLHALLNLAVRDRILPANPLRGYKALKEDHGRLRWLSDSEEARLREHMEPWKWRFVQIAFLSGMRQSEQFLAKTNQVLLDANVLRLPLTKSGYPREVPMGADLRRLIIKQLELAEALGSEWLFPHPLTGTAWSGVNFYRKHFKPALAKAGIRDLRWHDLRHTYCSRLAMAGTPLRTIQLLAGHRSITITERYAKLSPDHLHEAVKVLDREEEP
jgi:site-specific recombinase XerD